MLKQKQSEVSVEFIKHDFVFDVRNLTYEQITALVDRLGFDVDEQQQRTGDEPV